MKRKKSPKSSERDSHKKRKKDSKCLSPPFDDINTIEDLLYIAWNYKGDLFDWFTLWNIIPPLTELSKMVGMKELKQGVIDLILYNLQKLNFQGDNVSDGDMFHTVLYGPPGIGKCFAKDTPIMMYNGDIKMIQDISTGEHLMGDDSTPRRVLSTASGKEMMYRIEQDYGDDYIVNESHILSLKLREPPRIENYPCYDTCIVVWYDSRKEKRRRVLSDEVSKFMENLPQKGTVIDISVRDYLKTTRSWKNAYGGYKVGVEYPHKEVGIDPYVLGQWIGTELFKGNSELDILTKDRKENLWSKYIDDLKKGFIPKDYLINSRKNREELLYGLLHSTGEIFGYSCNISQKNKNISVCISNVAKSLGYYTVTSKTLDKDGIPNLFSNFIIGLGKEKSCDQTSLDVYNIRVVQLAEDNYYGFQIDGNKRFLLGDFTVTHNTTVAHILADIYCKMGFLTTEKVVVAKRNDFIGKWIGHSESQTTEILDSALGGVLLIDEAYSMGNTNKTDSFSKAYIDLINQYLSEHKRELICIIAGYEKELSECFFSINPGLERRFPWKFTISPYSSTEMAAIFQKKVFLEGWELRENLSEFFSQNKNYFPFFGGDIDNFFTLCKTSHSRRIFGSISASKKVLCKRDILRAFEIFKSRQKKKELPDSIKILYN